MVDLKKKKKKAVTQINQQRGLVDHFCLGAIFVLLRQCFAQWAWFCLDVCITVTKWPCLMLIFCATVYVKETPPFRPFLLRPDAL